MFNTTSNVSKSETQIKTPATGTIQRTYNKSFFLCFHQNSPFAGSLFCDLPKYGNKEIMIIQMMLINDGHILAECIYVEDNLL